jgi:sterol desaturase/sphingolipid hydroxylase (fatty acid hydroxylase superfamily)
MLMLVLAAAIALTLFVAELVYARRKRLRLYGLGDTLTNISATAFEQIFIVFAVAPAYALYAAVYRFRLIDRMPAALALAVAFVGVDFGFYVWHRLSHRISIMWFGHAVHHSSEEFNVSVAIRASGWSILTQRFFYLPMAAVGVPVEALVVADGLSNIYTLFVHNRVVGKLGVLERFLVTPSHHRVHHARNPEYLDKNFGATFIVWDRLFGTFATEEGPPVFGLRHPLQTHNVVWARFHILFEIADRMRRANGIRAKLSAPFRPPEWDPAGTHDTKSAATPSQPLAIAAPRRVLVYGIVQHVVLFALVAVFIAKAPGMGTAWRVLVGLGLWGSLAVVGAWLDARRWAGIAEVARWSVAFAVLLAA